MKKIIVYFISGVFAVLITGMIFYRYDIFNIHSPNFQFVDAGVAASLMYAVAMFREKRDIFYVAVILVFIHLIIFRPLNYNWMVRDIVYIAGVISASVFYAKNIYPLIYKYKLGKLFALPFVFGIFYMTAFLLLSALLYVIWDFSIPNYIVLLIMNLKYGAIIGFGLAVGFNFADFLVKQYID